MGLKKTRFGAGKYNGFGGKVEAGETIESTAIREVKEEVGLTVSEENLHPVGRLTFLFPANPAWDRMTHVSLVTKCEGRPMESAEMRPVWFAVGDILFEQMWKGDVHWIPRVLVGERILFLASGRHLGPMPGELAYIASKGALHPLRRSLSARQANRSITSRGGQDRIGAVPCARPTIDQ
jgi:8-oxo-dGTP pyrophosphatase MutT (NUDIX family)